jgi:signal peptidase II
MRKQIFGWALPLLIVVPILLLDQLLKIYIKLNFTIGERADIIPGLIELQFIENDGMAFGWAMPGVAGKLLLTGFRLIASVGIGVYLYKLIERKSHTGLLVGISMIWAGAIGNIIDSAVYGRLFSHSGWGTVAHFGMEDGYAPWLMANVVDMFHFTVTWPSWMPSFMAGAEVFPPIWNVADASISIAVFWIIMNQKMFFGNTPQSSEDA